MYISHIKTELLTNKYNIMKKDTTIFDAIMAMLNYNPDTIIGESAKFADPAFVPTALSIVYGDGLLLKSKKDLDLRETKKVWGICFKSGIILERISDANDFSAIMGTKDFTWLGKKRCRLPSEDELKSILNEKAAAVATFATLRELGISADGFYGNCLSNNNTYISLADGKIHPAEENIVGGKFRIAFIC